MVKRKLTQLPPYAKDEETKVPGRGGGTASSNLNYFVYNRRLAGLTVNQERGSEAWWLSC